MEENLWLLLLYRSARSILRCTKARYLYFFFFFNDTATTEIYTLSLHDALPILQEAKEAQAPLIQKEIEQAIKNLQEKLKEKEAKVRSEEHTSELQSH